ncbi:MULTISPECIES: response regulator transcription factor [Culturomica]|jgi:DNA-binding response OmpR family regulator|uniref:response regulator transcription factor n=1 Tax=Culturomica TaxID=1926651 RepID=UPI00034019EC|nr:MULTISPECIES: response regulator transcription factor [Odoribacteraceae]RHV88813.1 DNA-binding response regulator [Odoribacter sp. OF09-27XD]CCZ09866.1 two-component system response regulator [Odoribacter sp. CAG:788]HBO26016.1 DNA-binding response regulator [Culturomica sp.]
MKSIKILFIDDDIHLGNIITSGLSLLGYKVHFQNSLFAVEEIISQFSPAIIILDVEIGNDNGIEKARELIRKYPWIPVLFVSSHTDISYITEGIAAGGICYIRKPFDIKELEAYILRFAQQESSSSTIKIGNNYTFHTTTSELFCNELLIKKLSPLEKNTLLLFWENQNTLVSLDLLAKTLWGKKYSADAEASIYNLIFKLRKLLNYDRQLSISTIKGLGYQMNIL